MSMKWPLRIIQSTAIALTLTAVLQEMEKPREQREWHGKVLDFIPYDFRMPTLERIRDSYWNPDTDRIFTPEVFGLGWAINIYALVAKFHDDSGPIMEEDFLMPTPSIKEIITQSEFTQ
ncbi:DUF5808 domain-containing protein [Chloroflexota bacterium]